MMGDTKALDAVISSGTNGIDDAVATVFVTTSCRYEKSTQDKGAVTSIHALRIADRIYESKKTIADHQFHTRTHLDLVNEHGRSVLHKLVPKVETSAGFGFGAVGIRVGGWGMRGGCTVGHFVFVRRTDRSACGQQYPPAKC
jgi:hypothetical protein